MPKSSAFAHAHLLLIFNGTAIAHLADNAATAPATGLTVAIHSADPGAGGDQTTSEVVYPGYARVVVPRSALGFTVTGNVVTPAAVIEFPVMTAGTGDTARFWSIGDGVSDDVMYRGVLAPDLVITAGIAPKIDAASTLTEAT